MPIFIDLFVIIVAILLILIVLTQMVVPLFSGEPMFPIFRKSAVKEDIAKAEHMLGEVAEAAHLKRVVTEIKRQTAELEKKE
jgi:hypothetical protein